MDYTINQIVDYFAKSSIEFVDIITNQVLPHHTNGNRTTARGYQELLFHFQVVRIFHSTRQFIK